MCVPLIVTIPGLLGLAVLTHADGSPMVLVPESDPRAGITHQTFNDVLPLLMGKYLGPGLLGLGITAMIAGFMSGMAGNVSAFATVWTYDVYRPLLVKNASDRHYLGMGRACSILGVLLSIGTAYMLFFFSNILEFLQVLVFFFIVPLFGVVIVGMLWKRATKAGGFWGFLTAILVSISMWVYVHWFPEGFRPQPALVLQTVRSTDQPEVPVVVSKIDKKKIEGREKIDSVVVESGVVKATNVPIPSDAVAQDPAAAGTLVVQKEVALPSVIDLKSGKGVDVRVLAPAVVYAGSLETAKFGDDRVTVVLKPGVKVESSNVTKHFVPAEFNPAHTKYVARSEKAKPMAVNMYSAFWTFVVSVVVAVGVSLFTTPKPDEELKNLVMGLTPLPDEGPCSWYERPLLWAALVGAVLVTINILFW